MIWSKVAPAFFLTSIVSSCLPVSCKPASQLCWKNHHRIGIRGNSTAAAFRGPISCLPLAHCPINGRKGKHIVDEHSDDDAWVLLLCRGGASTTGLSRYFSASVRRCWVALLFAILMDALSTTIMKVAQDEASLPKLALAYSGYFFR